MVVVEERVYKLLTSAFRLVWESPGYVVIRNLGYEDDAVFINLHVGRSL